MASTSTYILKTGSTWDTTAIPDGMEFSITESGSPTSLSSDGSRFVDLVVVDQIGVNITVTTHNQDLNSTKFKVGYNGALVLIGQKRACGNTMDADTLTFTVAHATITDISSTIPHDGAGQTVITFAAFTTDNTYPVARS